MPLCTLARALLMACEICSPFCNRLNENRLSCDRPRATAPQPALEKQIVPPSSTRPRSVGLVFLLALVESAQSTVWVVARYDRGWPPTISALLRPLVLLRVVVVHERR